MMEEGLDRKGYAQLQAEIAISELVQLNAELLRVVNLDHQPKPRDYEALVRKYFEVLQNAGEVISTEREDYKIPTSPKQMSQKVLEFINRLNKHGFYNVGKRRAQLVWQ